MRSVLASTRARLVVLGVAAAGALGVLGATGLQEDLVYYRTPSEVAVDTTHDQRVRLGGLVAQGSVSREADLLRFVLADGAHDVSVTYEGTAPGIFREGQGAVVEGTFDSGGAFTADNVLVKHDNQYVDGSMEVE